VDGLGVGRVIARPFVGAPGGFRRTANRRDFAMPPRDRTVLDHVSGAGWPVVAIGKIEDLFAGRGITRAVHTRSDDDGMDQVMAALDEVERGLVFANLVDFDALYGHRNDTAGYAANLERVDARLAALLPRLAPRDLLVITADHGNDPTTPSTDHSREHVPVLVTGAAVARLSANAAIARNVLSNEATPQQRDIVVLNAGCVIYTANQAKDIQEGIQKAVDALESGRAQTVLERAVEISRS